MMEIAVRILNYAGYLAGCNVLGNWFAKLYWSWFAFIGDDEYREAHPKMYVAKVIGAMVMGILLALAIIWYPLTKLMKWIDDKITEHFRKEDKKEEEDEDLDFLD